MLLNVKSTAVNISVAFFFGFSLIGWIRGLSPDVCCKRAVIGALLAYIASIIAAKAINAVLIEAMIDNRFDRLKEDEVEIRQNKLKAG